MNTYIEGPMTEKEHAEPENFNPWPSIYSSPICGQPHPRHEWRCTLPEGHPGPHAVLITAHWGEP
jgi:hypothetical protein